jgi:Tfp pilus assembly protein PilX
MRRRLRAQRGYALITAIVLAVLYFGLMQLMMMESSRELAEARRFRARIVALTLAENAIELGAAGMIEGPRAPGTLTDDQGTIEVSERTVNGDANAGTFFLKGHAETSGSVKLTATAYIKGRMEKQKIIIEWSEHSQ